MASEEEGTRKGSGVRGSWEGLHCRGHPLAREADFYPRGSTFPFLRVIHFHFLYHRTFFTVITFTWSVALRYDFISVESFTMRRKNM